MDTQERRFVRAPLAWALRPLFRYSYLHDAYTPRHGFDTLVSGLRPERRSAGERRRQGSAGPRPAGALPVGRLGFDRRLGWERRLGWDGQGTG